MISFILGSLCFILGCVVGIVLMALGQSEWDFKQAFSIHGIVSEEQ